MPGRGVIAGTPTEVAEMVRLCIERGEATALEHVQGGKLDTEIQTWRSLAPAA